jgi:hypothetical protein
VTLLSSGIESIYSFNITGSLYLFDERQEFLRTPFQSSDKITIDIKSKFEDGENLILTLGIIDCNYLIEHDSKQQVVELILSSENFTKFNNKVSFSWKNEDSSLSDFVKDVANENLNIEFGFKLTL